MKRNLLLMLSFFVLSFGMNAQVSMVGPGSPAGNWTDNLTDTYLESSDGLHWTLNNVTMQGGEFKFRWNHDWAINWGGTGFPTGTGLQSGANIVAVAGTYDVTVDFSGDPASGTATATWIFSGGTPISVVSLIGTSITGSEVAFSTADGTNYTASNVTLIDGSAQFTIDSAVFGGTDFPEGDATDPSLFIPVTSGTYTSISFDKSTGHYLFTAAPVYPTISIIGASIGGWVENVNDLDLHTTDGINYYYYGVAVTEGVADAGIKFRTNHAWGQPNYGGTGWPAGTAATDAGNIIPTESGGYDVTFNLTTLEYTFSVPQISLIGAAFNGWNEGNDIDMTTTDNGITYTIPSATSAAGGECKFRSNHTFDSPNAAYGSADGLTGTATYDVGNITVPAGTYGITFNHVTGEYSFGAPLATKSFNANGFKVYPNPTTNNWNFNSSSNEKISAVRIVDMLGKTVITVSADAASAKVDASSLNAGIYFAKVSTAAGEATVKLVKN